MIRSTRLTTLAAAALLPLLAHATAEQQFPTEEGQITVSTVADGLRNPWALAFLPGGRDMLVTERPGNLRLVNAEGKVGPPINGVPKVWAEGQGGLLDVVLSPEFAKDRTLYLSYAEAGNDGKAGTAVGRGQLSEDRARLENFNVIFRQQPKLSVGNHFGSRLVFDRNGYLFIALGENNQRPTAQDLDKLQGKIVRILPDGEVPKDCLLYTSDAADE